MIVNTLPTGEFPHASYGIIFSDPCIAPNTMTSGRVCARYTKNEYFLDFEVKLIELNTDININHNGITLQILIETY